MIINEEIKHISKDRKGSGGKRLLRIFVDKRVFQHRQKGV